MSLPTLFRTNFLLKLTWQNSIGILVKLFTGLAASKIVATYIGPSGMALLGNLRNTTNVVHQFSTGGLEEAAIRYTAEYKNKKERLASFVATLLFVGGCLSILVGLVLFFGRSFWNALLFPGKDFQFIFKIVAFLLPLSMLNFFSIALLKGLGEFKKVIWINLLTNLLNVLLIGLLVWQYGLEGALFTVVILPALALLITLSFAQKQLNLWSYFKWKNVSKLYRKNLSQYAVMTLISSLVFPIVYVSIRNTIIAEIGVEEAGYWEALTRMSNYYLLFVLSLLSLYVLPKLAETKTSEGFRKVVFQFYKNVLPFFVVGLVVIYLLRQWLVPVIFSKDFLPMKDLFFWQLVGDLLRVLALVISYQLRAKKMIWGFICTELFLAGFMYFSSVYLLNEIGLRGAVVAYALSWGAYGIVIIAIFRKVFFYKWFR